MYDKRWARTVARNRYWLINVTCPLYSRPRPSRQPLYQYELANSPGHSIIGMLVEFHPHGSFPPHRHGGASVVGYVIQGTILNQMNDEPTRVITEGDTWYEAPGCHHKVFENASKTESAKVVATYVVDTKIIKEEGYAALTVIDEEYRDVVAPS